MFEVTVTNVAGEPAAIGSAGPHTLVVDRPEQAGGRGIGFNGGELLYLAVAGCISNDLFREAGRFGVSLDRVRIRVTGSFEGDPAVSGPVVYHVDVSGAGTPEQLRELVEYVDRIAEIPNSLRGGTNVQLGEVTTARSSEPTG